MGRKRWCKLRGEEDGGCGWEERIGWDGIKEMGADGSLDQRPGWGRGEVQRGADVQSGALQLGDYYYWTLEEAATSGSERDWTGGSDCQAASMFSAPGCGGSGQVTNH